MALSAHLLFDSISRNTGDIAIGTASAQMFAARGISSTVVDPLGVSGDRQLIVGGGELLRNIGDDFYDRFRPQGRHILNAAGVWTGADKLDYLNEYAFVSARSSLEADVLSKSVQNVQVLPCATTLLSSEKYVIDGVDDGEKVVGIHLAPHALRAIEDLIPIVNSIPHKKVFIPFTHYNSDRSFMNSLPFDRSNVVLLDELQPLQLHSVLSQMTYVLVTSLHASIFSYSQNVPFAAVRQPKVENYFRDRGLDHLLVGDSSSLRDVLDMLDTQTTDFTSLIERDRTLINTAFDRYAELLAESGEMTSTLAPASVDANTLMQAQAAHVIADRDLALSHIESRRLSVTAERDNLLSQQIGDRARISQLTVELDDARNHWTRRVARVAIRPLRAVRRRLARMLK